MRSRAAAKGRRLLFLAAVCLASALLLSPTAEASRSLPASTVSLEPPAPRWEAEAPPAPRLELFHLEDDLLLETLTGVEPEHHQALLEHRRLELLPSASWNSAIQKTASRVSTSDLELNVQKGQALKPDLRWTVPFYAKARFYDPEVGRFLTEDPAEPDLTTPPSLHRYLYAYGNPTRYWDPFGLWPEEPEEDASWTAKALAWVKSFVGVIDVKDAGANLHEASRAFDEQVYGRSGTGSSLEEEIARREEHRQGVAETTGIVLENTQEAGTKLATAAVKATDAAGIAGVAKKGGRKLVSEILDTADNRIASRADDVARKRAVSESTQAGTKQADDAALGTTNERKLPVLHQDQLIIDNYQRYYNEAWERVASDFNAGKISIPAGMHWKTVLGQRVDAIARNRLKKYLAREGISEGPGTDVLVNRWLRDPKGTGRYRIPDVRLEQTGTIPDGTIGSKTMTSSQVQDFVDFSEGHRVIIVRPETSPGFHP